MNQEIVTAISWFFCNRTLLEHPKQEMIGKKGRSYVIIKKTL